MRLASRTPVVVMLGLLVAACGRATGPDDETGPNGNGPGEPTPTVGRDTLPNRPTAEDRAPTTSS
ncbi:MAG: hypothetical protein ACODAE_06240 [Gemmatimonadota bacterium]